MGRRGDLRKETDYETRFRCAGGIGMLREEVWVNSKDEVVQYNLAFLLPHLSRADKGRVLGFDNAHGTHERHYMGEVRPVPFRGVFGRQRSVFIGKLRPSGEAMKTKVFHDGFEGHVQRSLKRATKREQGERLEAEKIITFADPLDMIECLTAQRVRICQVVRQKQLSISSLAEELGRNRGSVTRDVNKLKGFGLLRLREQVNPGHGVVQIVEPVAQKFEMRIAF